jgi:hypothetical protein
MEEKLITDSRSSVWINGRRISGFHKNSQKKNADVVPPADRHTKKMR